MIFADGYDTSASCQMSISFVDAETNVFLRPPLSSPPLLYCSPSRSPCLFPLILSLLPFFSLSSPFLPPFFHLSPLLIFPHFPLGRWYLCHFTSSLSLLPSSLFTRGYLLLPLFTTPLSITFPFWLYVQDFKYTLTLLPTVPTTVFIVPCTVGSWNSAKLNITVASTCNFQNAAIGIQAGMFFLKHFFWLLHLLFLLTWIIKQWKMKILYYLQLKWTKYFIQFQQMFSKVYLLLQFLPLLSNGMISLVILKECILFISL